MACWHVLVVHAMTAALANIVTSCAWWSCGTSIHNEMALMTSLAGASLRVALSVGIMAALLRQQVFEHT